MKKTVDLECGGLMLFQDGEGYAFTTDAVLLANLADIRKDERVVELGSGSGVISILLYSKTEAKEIIGVEIQKRLYEMSVESLALNNIKDRLSFINADMKEAHRLLGANSFDAAICNPPYEKAGKASYKNEETAICKSEIAVSLDEVAASAKRLLKYGGRFCMIHKAERLTDITVAMRSNGIEPLKLILISQNAEKAPDRVIVEGRKGGKGKLKIESFTLYGADGKYSPAARRIYNR